MINYNQQFGYQPYNPYQSNQFQYPQSNQQYNGIQNQMFTQQQSSEVGNSIPCVYVDSIKVVDATNSDMSGRPLLFMKSDGSEIYKKQINPQTGASVTSIYKISELDNIESNSAQNITESLCSIQQEVQELKNIVLDSLTRPSPNSKNNGGVK